MKWGRTSTQKTEDETFDSFLYLAFPVLVVASVMTSCEEPSPEAAAQEIINKAIDANGAHLFPSKKVSFDFRDRSYSSERVDGDFVYRRSFEDSVGWTEDQLVNSTDFSRKLAGHEVNLTEEWQKRYSNSVNSVLYFVEILYRLNDDAVNKTYWERRTSRVNRIMW